MENSPPRRKVRGRKKLKQYATKIVYDDLPPPPRRKVRRKLTPFQKIKLRVTHSQKYKGQKIQGDYDEAVELLEEGSTSEEEPLPPIVPRDYETHEELVINSKPRGLEFVEEQALMETLEKEIIKVILHSSFYSVLLITHYSLRNTNFTFSYNRHHFSIFFLLHAMTNIGKDVEVKFPKRTEKGYGTFYMESPDVLQFMELSNCPDERVALYYLEEGGYDVDRAVKM